MRGILISVILILVTSSVYASVKSITEQDLMNHLVGELEETVIGNQVDIYDPDAVIGAIRKHQQYLMLCANKMAQSKCEQAKEELTGLSSAWNVHFQFQKDMAEMWNTHSTLMPEKLTQEK